MKKIFPILAFIICTLSVSAQQRYKPSLHAGPQNKPSGISSATPLDSRSYFYDTLSFSYRPYANRAEILSYLYLASYRSGQFSIIMDSIGHRWAYWFRDGTADNNLVLQYNFAASTTDSTVFATLYKVRQDSIALSTAINGKLPNTLATGKIWIGDLSGNAQQQTPSNDISVTVGGSATVNNQWKLIGNAGTADLTNFIGTTDNVPFSIKVNNRISGRIDPSNANTFLGYRSGGATTSSNNTAIGYGAMIVNGSGGSNTSIGTQSLFNNTFGNQNTALGYNALSGNITGNNNTVLGANSGGGLSTGSNNTILGANVSSLGAALNNNIIIADGQGNQRITVDSFGNVVINSTTALLLPKGTTAQRPATPIAGYRRFNTDSSAAETYNGTIWLKDGTGGSGSGITLLNGLSATTQLFAIGTSGSIPNISSVSNTHTFNLPLSTAHVRGVLDSTDFVAFSNKLSNITGLITEGTNITVTGSGTSGSPYVITATAGSGINQLNGDVLAGPGIGNQTATIANNAVTYAKLQTLPAGSVFGNPTGSTANSRATFLKYGLSFNVDSVKVDTTLTGVATNFALNDSTRVTGDIINLTQKRVDLSDTGNTSGASAIRVGTKDSILIAYEIREGSDFSAAHIQLTYYYKGHFTPPFQLVASTHTEQAVPNLFNLTNDSIAIIWAEYTSDTDNPFYIMKSADHGRTWGTKTLLQTNSVFALINQDRVFTSTTGRKYLPWADHVTGSPISLNDPASKYRGRYKYSDDGTTWILSPQIFLSPDSACFEPGMYERPLNLSDPYSYGATRLVYYWRNRSGVIFYSYSDDNGTTWQAAIRGIPANNAPFSQKYYTKNKGLFTIINQVGTNQNSQDAIRKQMVLLSSHYTNPENGAQQISTPFSLDSGIAYTQPQIFLDSLKNQIICFGATINRITGHNVLYATIIDAATINGGIQDPVPTNSTLTLTGGETLPNGQQNQLYLYSNSIGTARGSIGIGNTLTTANNYWPGIKTLTDPVLGFYGRLDRSTLGIDGLATQYSTGYYMDVLNPAGGTVTASNLFTVGNNDVDKFHIAFDGQIFTAKVDSIAAPADSSVLIWDKATNRIKRARNWGGGGGGSSSLAGLSDVTLTSPTSGQVLQYNGTKWVNMAGFGGTVSNNTFAMGGPSTGGLQDAPLTYNGSNLITSSVRFTVNNTITADGTGFGFGKALLTWDANTAIVASAISGHSLQLQTNKGSGDAMRVEVRDNTNNGITGMYMRNRTSFGTADSLVCVTKVQMDSAIAANSGGGHPDTLHVVKIGAGKQIGYTNGADTLFLKAITNAIANPDSSLTIQTFQEADQTLTGNRIVTLGTRNLTFDATSSGLFKISGSKIGNSGSGYTIFVHNPDSSVAQVSSSTLLTDAGWFQGTYTPTVTNVSNGTSITNFLCQYYKVGAEVVIDGKFQVAATSGGSPVSVTISLPISSGSLGGNDAFGVATATQNSSFTGTFQGNTSNVQLNLSAPATGSVQTVHFHCTYIWTAP